MSGEGYEGWANRETWAWSLQMSNDQDLYNLKNEAVQAGLLAYATWAEANPRPFDGRGGPVGFIADALREEVTEHLLEHLWSGSPKNHRELLSLFQDIGSLWRVDYREIAANELSALEE